MRKMLDYKDLYVYSKKIAVEMRKRGNKCIGTIPNFNYPQYDIYLFENTPKTNKDLDEIIDNMKV